MNSSKTFLSQETSSQCEIHILLGGTLDHTTTETYAVLVFIIVINIITCPITTVLNALVVIAVKTKPRLQTLSNIALACLATTDGVMGVLGQALFIAGVARIIEGNCLTLQLRSVMRFFSAASLFLLALINVERYIAVKHPYATIVTKARLIRSSVVLWMITLLLTVLFAVIYSTIYVTVINICYMFSVAVIIFCQVVLYREIRWHKKQIAAQQVSVEAREKFLKDQKALKVTTTVLFFLVFSYSPIIVARILIVNNVIESVNLAYVVFFTSTVAVIFKSLVNPVIYCVRIRQFRVAFIEVLLQKTNTEAEETELRVCGRLNFVSPLEEVQETEEA